MRQMAAWINPFAFLDVDLAATPQTRVLPNAESVLAFMSPAGTQFDGATLVQRYREIS
jgi:hypothetical protein